MTNEKQRASLIRLRWVCRWVILGSAIYSVWANVLHAGNFNVITWIFAAAPPIIVLVGFELVSRIPISDAPWYRRVVRPLVTVGIAFGGAWLSYWHQVDAVNRYTTDTEAAHILPLLIDGLMVIASVSVYELNEHLRTIDARIAGVAVRTTTRKPEAPRKDAKKDLAKVKIAQILANSPGLKPVDVAKLAGTSYNYAYSVMKELQKETEPQMA